MTALVGLPKPRWRLRDPYAHQNGIANFPPIVATVLAARGITTRAQADLFYKPHLAPDYDPLELPGMHEASERPSKSTRPSLSTATSMSMASLPSPSSMRG